MLEKFKIRVKINIIGFINLLCLSLLIVFVLYIFKDIENSYNKNNYYTDVTLNVTKSTEQGIQLASSLRGFLIDPTDIKSKDNYLKAAKDLDSFMKELSKTEEYNLFNLNSLYANHKQTVNVIANKLLQNQQLDNKDNNEYIKTWRVLKEKLIELQKQERDKKEELEKSFFQVVNNSTIFIAVLILVNIVLMLLISMYIAKNIVNKISQFRDGLLSFFSFLNKESNNVHHLDDSSKDEFGEMAKVINHNIEKTEKLIMQDHDLIENVKQVVNEVKAGYLNKRIEKNTQNESLEELKNTFNEMLESTSKNVAQDINKLAKILDSFAKLDFSVRIENDSGMVSIGLNNLADIINEMLVENKSNGLTLDQSSNILLSNVDKLNVSSNEAAASLEETAAALEEITSNIRNTTENIAKMSKYSNSVTKSASTGEKLANKTTVAMDEINNQVNLITEAISVIDQIAFQTNILSLNAAVEAATAGEAGKGFAVVAQEVRNLASRSAEAAKEIKNIVENAKNKADEGKEIAGHMIDGYKELNESIQQTINLISDIEMSSKEQLSGIEQINDAVNSLDQQTQQNAQIASQTHDAAGITDEIAKLILDDANKKEFKGKNEVKGRNVNIKPVTTSYEVKTHTPPKKTATPVKHVEPKVTAHKADEDEWESF